MLTRIQQVTITYKTNQGEIMQITTITYGLTVNRGDYNSERLEMTGLLAEGDGVKVSLNTIQNQVRSALKLPTIALEGVTNDEPTKKKATKKATKKASKKTTKANKSGDEGDISKDVQETSRKSSESEITTSPEVESGKEREVPYTLAEVKDTIKALAKAKGRECAMDLLKDFGVAKTIELKEDQYGDFIKACKKGL